MHIEENLERLSLLRNVAEKLEGLGKFLKSEMREVERKMWCDLYPGPELDQPIIEAIREEVHALNFDKFLEKHKLLQKKVYEIDKIHLDIPPEFDFKNFKQ